jgi:hypothetical protein
VENEGLYVIETMEVSGITTEERRESRNVDEMKAT